MILIRPLALVLAATAPAFGATFLRDPLAVPESAKVTVSRDDYPGLTRRHAVAVKDAHANDTSINWSWTPRSGYPDQFRRDRIVTLDISPDGGYSSWTQLANGSIVILDYTNAPSPKPFAAGKGPPPIVRAYLVAEKDLVR